MVTEKQRANLAKGRQKGIKRKPTANKCDANNTFAGIFHFIESREITEQEWQTLALVGIRKADVIAAGITDYRKLKKCVNIFVDDSPAMAREYMQRSEPQSETLNVQHGGGIVFSHDVITRLIERRPIGNSSKPGAG